MIENAVMIVGHFASEEMTVEPTIPIMMPMTPPSMLNTSASIRNWVRISRPRAPIDIRMPISRVRSVTETSMIFIIPMPPTKSETDAILASSIVRISVVAVAVFAMSV